MRIRFVVLAFLGAAVLAAAVAACAAPDGAAGRPGAPATSAATRTTSTPAAARRHPPREVIPVAKRQPAPALRVTAFDGATVTIDGFRGRVAVVNFFESWCPICMAEQPDLSQVAREFAGRAGFVGVSYHDTVAAGRAYQRRYAIAYPLANDASGRTWARWRVPYQPVTVLVDPQGRVAARYDGGATAGTLRTALQALLGE